MPVNRPCRLSRLVSPGLSGSGHVSLVYSGRLSGQRNPHSPGYPGRGPRGRKATGTAYRAFRAASPAVIKNPILYYITTFTYNEMRASDAWNIWGAFRLSRLDECPKRLFGVVLRRWSNSPSSVVCSTKFTKQIKTTFNNQRPHLFRQQDSATEYKLHGQRSLIDLFLAGDHISSV